MKPEPDVDNVPKAKRQTSSTELYTYNVEELSKFNKRELIADAELLDGS